MFGEELGKLLGEPFDLLLGRRTYEIFAAYDVRDGEVKTATIGGAQEPTPAERARCEKVKREG